MQYKSVKVDLLCMLLWPLLAAFIVLNFPINAFYSSIVFYGVPSIYLSLRKPSFVLKAFSLSFLGLPLMIIVDYVAELTGSWLWPLPNSIFSFRLFNVVSMEVLLWLFLHIYFAILFYERFLDRHKVSRLWYPRSRQLVIFTVTLFSIFVLVFLIYPHILLIPYWYLIFGIVLILPPVLFEEFRYPMVFPKILKAGLYFFYLNFIYEIAALKLGRWSFPGKEFIGYVSFFGVAFPFEEFFFWVILFTIALLSHYEYFFDDER